MEVAMSCVIICCTDSETGGGVLLVATVCDMEDMGDLVDAELVEPTGGLLSGVCWARGGCEEPDLRASSDLC